MKYFTKNSKNHNTMKKLFIVLAVASLGFVACNNEGTAEAAKDSLTQEVKDAGNAAIDSVNKMADTATNKIDSTVKATVDSLKK